MRDHGQPALSAVSGSSHSESARGCAVARARSEITRTLIVASARLPVTAAQSGSTWSVVPSAGGLATALRSVSAHQHMSWFGLPGPYIPESERVGVARRLLECGCRPVFVNKPELEGFSGSFSNAVLWPLFHALAGRSHLDLSGWKSYQAVNARFADAIAEVAGPDDLVWIHDYQLALVPALLRRRGVECPIGFFLHVPFPSGEIFNRLPLREELLRGLLGADLIGFHTHEYVGHFLECCQRVLGSDCKSDSIKLQHRDVRVAALPVGVDPDEILRMIERGDVQQELAELERVYAGTRIVVGVDRLDYTKGIPEKLYAFEELLRTKPEWRGRVVLIQIGAPTRDGVGEYRKLRREVEELVGRINGQYGTPSFSPVVYVGQTLPRERLAALYRAADVAFVTPLRDGMNLVALEYVIARKGRGGVLLLSEFAGAAHWLAGARLVNPYSIARTAEALGEALKDADNTTAPYQEMLRFATENTASRWAFQFLERLEQGKAGALPPRRLRFADPELVTRIQSARHPLLLLDYDGTLRGFETDPERAAPDSRLERLLAELARLGVVYVVSGRPARTLDNWLGELGVGLVCEHGLAIKRPGGVWHKRARVSGRALRRTIEPVLRDFVRRTPGSLLEKKTSSLAWHYRAAEPEFGAMQARLLSAVLDQMVGHGRFEVLRGSRVIEVLHRGVTKARALSHLLRAHPDADLLFCAGDDVTDDEMMAAIPPAWCSRAITCSVGVPRRSADFLVESSDSLLLELEVLVQLRKRLFPVRTPGDASARRSTPGLRRDSTNGLEQRGSDVTCAEVG